MPPKKSKSRKRKKEVQDAESPNSESNNSESAKPTNNKESRRRSGITSTSTTNEPSSASATVATSIAEATNPTSFSASLPVATAATAAAPTVPLSGKKPHKAGVRDKFLKKLKLLLDRESQNDDATVHWSTGGNSFIITDHTQFEEEIIPKYFGNPIVFASFLRKLQRWGFVRVSSKRSGRYEFSSPIFKRVDSRSAQAQAPAAAAGAVTTTTNVAVNDGERASIQFPQQHQQVMVAQEQIMAQLSQQPIMPVPAPNQLPRQADASAIADLISNIQRRSQQPSTSSQQPGPNQHTNQMNIADVNSTLQNIIDSHQHQPITSQNSVPNQQPVPNHASQLDNVAGNNHQTLQQWQHPNNPTMNLLNSALQSLATGSNPSAQAMGQYPPSSVQSSAVHSLISLSGMLPQVSPLNTTPTASQSSNSEPILLLLLAIKQFVEEEYQRRAQVDALHQGIIATIGHIVDQNNVMAEAGGFGRAGEINVHLRNPTGMTVRVPNNSNTQPNQEGARQPPVSAENNIQADSITAILQPAPRGDAIGQPEENAHAQNNDPAANNGNEDVIDEGEVDEPLSPRNRRSSDNYEADEDDWNKRLRKRKKSPPK